MEADPPSPSKQQARASKQYTKKQRVILGVAYAISILQFATLNAALEAAWGRWEKDEPLPPHASRHASFWWEHLLTKATTKTAHHEGSPIVPDNLIREAGKLIKGGYTKEIPQRIGVPQIKHFYYPTIGRAISMLPSVAQLLADYKVDKHYLLRRLHVLMPT